MRPLELPPVVRLGPSEAECAPADCEGRRRLSSAELDTMFADLFARRNEQGGEGPRWAERAAALSVPRPGEGTGQRRQRRAASAALGQRGHLETVREADAGEAGWPTEPREIEASHMVSGMQVPDGEKVNRIVHRLRIKIGALAALQLGKGDHEQDRQMMQDMRIMRTSLHGQDNLVSGLSGRMVSH